MTRRAATGGTAKSDVQPEVDVAADARIASTERELQSLIDDATNEFDEAKGERRVVIKKSRGCGSEKQCALVNFAPQACIL